jgi:hypothetical protein
MMEKGRCSLRLESVGAPGYHSTFGACGDAAPYLDGGCWWTPRSTKRNIFATGKLRFSTQVKWDTASGLAPVHGDATRGCNARKLNILQFLV